MFRTVKLVNRDQLDILAALRDEVSVDKVALESQLTDLRIKLRDTSDANGMQLAQINGLLLDKVGMQGDGIEQREALLKQERALGCVPSGSLVLREFVMRCTAIYDRQLVVVTRCNVSNATSRRAGRKLRGRQASCPMRKMCVLHSIYLTIPAGSCRTAHPQARPSVERSRLPGCNRELVHMSF